MQNAIASYRSTESGIVRCPVFKIDLKGRFVYVDEMTEQLLGRPQDMLFGRSLRDFLSEKSYSILLTIFQRYRHYETFFEAVELEFISPESGTRSLTAIISLNFIAGNPANYQVVLIPFPYWTEPRPEEANKEKIFAMLFDLAASLPVGESSDEALSLWKDLIEITLRFDEICLVGIYQYRDGKLGLLADSKGMKTGFDFKFSQIGDYHIGVVMNCNTYINAEYVIPELSESPGKGILTEICHPLMRGDKCWGLARFAVNKDSAELEEILLRISRFIGNAFCQFVPENQGANYEPR
jgi:hypothetical protein